MNAQYFVSLVFFSVFSAQKIHLRPTNINPVSIFQYFSETTKKKYLLFLLRFTIKKASECYKSFVVNTIRMKRE